MPGGGMHHQARRFVDDQQMLVLEHDMEGNVFSQGRWIERRRHAQAGGLAGAQQLTSIGHRGPIDRGMASLDQAFHACPREIFRRRREKTVEPLAALFRLNPAGEAKIVFKNRVHAFSARHSPHHDQGPLLLLIQ